MLLNCLLQIRKSSARDDVKLAFAIRKQVFVEEQNVPEELESDGLDKEAIHYLAEIDSRVIGTARVRYIDGGSKAKIERVAILIQYRGYGYGFALVKFILEDVKKSRNLKSIALGAQLSAVDFYKKYGFEPYGEEYLEAGIMHQNMQLIL